MKEAHSITYNLTSESCATKNLKLLGLDLSLLFFLLFLFVFLFYLFPFFLLFPAGCGLSNLVTATVVCQLPRWRVQIVAYLSRYQNGPLVLY